MQICSTFASGETRNRTEDTTIFSRVLYQLSYLAKSPANRPVFDTPRESVLELWTHLWTHPWVRGEPKCGSVGPPLTCPARGLEQAESSDIASTLPARAARRATPAPGLIAAQHTTASRGVLLTAVARFSITSAIGCCFPSD